MRAFEDQSCVVSGFNAIPSVTASCWEPFAGVVKFIFIRTLLFLQWTIRCQYKLYIQTFEQFENGKMPLFAKTKYMYKTN